MVALAAPILLALALIAVEAGVSAARGLARYDLRDTLANFGLGLGGLVVSLPGRALAMGVSLLAYEFRLFEIPNVWWAWVLLLVLEDLCYYVFHRVSHELPFFWAAHAAHHSSEHYNFSTSFRISWTTPFTGILFWLPLPLLGFHPVWVFAMHSASLAWQFLLHTKSTRSFGPLDWIIVTPSHHRVHHGRDADYRDRNYGAIFIVWDRLFGTFTRETHAPEYGTLAPPRSHNPVVIAFHDWRLWLKSVGRRIRGRAAFPSPLLGGGAGASSAAHSRVGLVP